MLQGNSFFANTEVQRTKQEEIQSIREEEHSIALEFNSSPVESRVVKH